MSTHIILIGFMASGKSTLGEQLADFLHRPLLDTDTYLEKKAGQSIPDIFATHGEPYFRKLESQVIDDLKTDLQAPQIIATGGGLPCRLDHMDRLNQLGISVFLDPPFEVLLGRLLRMRSYRPMLASYSDEELEQKMSALLATRRTWYEQAHIHLTQAFPSPEQAWEAILSHTENKKT